MPSYKANFVRDHLHFLLNLEMNTNSQNCWRIFFITLIKAYGLQCLYGVHIQYCWYYIEDNVWLYKRMNVYESGPYYSAGYCDPWSSFTIYFIVLFSTTETVGFGQHQWSDTFLYAGDKCTGYSAGSSVCRSISKPTWYVITLVWLLLFCLYHQGYWYAKMVVCQTITILSHITCTLLLWFSLIILISTFRFLNTNIS